MLSPVYQLAQISLRLVAMSRRATCVCLLAMSYGFSITLEHASRVSIQRFDIAAYGNQNAALRRATQCLKVAVMSGFVLHNCAREAPACVAGAVEQCSLPTTSKQLAAAGQSPTPA